MPENGESTPDNFLTLVEWWNLYGLPVLLLVVTVVVLVSRRRRASRENVAEPVSDASLAVSRIGLIQYGLTVRAAIFLVQQLLTMRIMGVAESFATLIISAIAVVFNPLVGLGLRRRPPRKRTRWFAIAWYLFLSSFSVLSAYWLWKYGDYIDPARWPDDLVWLGLPVFLLVIMLLPRTGRAFGKGVKSPHPLDAGEPAPATSPTWPWISLPVLLFLIVLGSTVTVELVDWIRRSVFETGEIP